MKLDLVRKGDDGGKRLNDAQNRMFEISASMNFFFVF